MCKAESDFGLICKYYVYKCQNIIYLVLLLDTRQIAVFQSYYPFVEPLQSNR